MDSNRFILGYYFDVLVKGYKNKEYHMSVIAENYSKAISLIEGYIEPEHEILSIKMKTDSNIVIDKDFIK